VTRGNPQYLKTPEKAFPLHKDVWAYYPDGHAAKEAYKDAKEKQLEEVMDALGDSNPFPQTQPLVPFRKHKAQYNDPICVLGLLDALLLSQRGIYIRPGYLLDTLNRKFPHYYWSTQIVGRMLAGLNEVSKNIHDGEIREVPFARGRDSKGNYYVMDPKGGNECLLWFIKVRQVTVDRVQNLMRAEAGGNFEVGLWASAYGDNQPAACYMDWFETTTLVRSGANYMAQWDTSKPLAPSQDRIDALPIFDPTAS